MTIIRKIAGYLFTIYAFAIFTVMMLLLFPFVVIASFFGKIRGGNLIYHICRFWASIVLFCLGIRHRNILETTRPHTQAVVYVFNHISYMDIPMLLKAFPRQHIRILGKAEMGKIPVFGYIYRKAVVMVSRESEESRLRSVREMNKMLRQDISVVIAPEGTFNMTGEPLKEFYNGAFKIAVQTQTPVQPVLLLDAYDRLHYNSIFSLSPGRSRAVFLPEQMPGKDVALLKQQVYVAMEDGLKRYKASWIKNG
ncbi:MAG: 1-acyl-sn-glycerol-3-phosphate acyltransferase [Ferruginibacter sp.]|nr:1-acyl-sn-glycerol-3-phosphate acyltransferase [Ferruginibacter sp.]